MEGVGDDSNAPMPTGKSENQGAAKDDVTEKQEDKKTAGKKRKQVKDESDDEIQVVEEKDVPKGRETRSASKKAKR